MSRTRGIDECLLMLAGRRSMAVGNDALSVLFPGYHLGQRIRLRSSPQPSAERSTDIVASASAMSARPARTAFGSFCVTRARALSARSASVACIPARKEGNALSRKAKNRPQKHMLPLALAMRVRLRCRCRATEARFSSRFEPWPAGGRSPAATFSPAAAA